MKAKMPPGQKIPETAEYLCDKCETRFHFDRLDRLRCPNCYTTNANCMVPVYVEEDPAEEEMMTPDDYGQGD